MKREDLVKYIQFYLSQENNSDPVVKSITPEDINTVLKRQCTSLNLDYEDLPPTSEGILICLTRKELYWKLATASAPMYELNMDGLKVSKQTRFDHYLKLIQQVEQEYINLINDPNRTLVTTGEAIIQKPYTMDNYVKSYKIPRIDLEVDNINPDNIELSFDFGHVDPKDYLGTELYIHTSPIVDKYDNNRVAKEAKLVLSSNNIRQVCHRVKGITPQSQTYYVMLLVKLRHGFKTYCEKEVTYNA